MLILITMRTDFLARSPEAKNSARFSSESDTTTMGQRSACATESPLTKKYDAVPMRQCNIVVSLSDSRRRTASTGAGEARSA
jgi:hypothetical protein